MGKTSVYSLNVYRAIPQLIDELYDIVIGGDASMNSITLTSTTASTDSTTIGAILSAGGISISNSTDAVSSTNGGGLTIAGGAAITKKLYIGDEIVIEGATNASSYTAGGALTVAGGISTAQDIYIGGDLYIAGTIFGLSFVPAVTTSTLTNITTVDMVGLSSIRTGTGINFSCVAIVTPTSSTPQDTSFRLSVDSGSWPPPTFTVPYQSSPAFSGWANTALNPISVENIVINTVVGTTDFFIKFTNYDNGIHYITIKIVYAHGGVA